MDQTTLYNHETKQMRKRVINRLEQHAEVYCDDPIKIKDISILLQHLKTQVSIGE